MFNLSLKQKKLKIERNVFLQFGDDINFITFARLLVIFSIKISKSIKIDRIFLNFLS